VNLSPRQFFQSDLSDQIAEQLEKSGLSPNCLKLEITESHIMENTDVVIPIMNRLRDLGIQISLDDFGTGYSSLSYLHRLPIDYLKIDRSFVSRLEESLENQEIVSTIIKLAQNLKMKVIAEGIETAEQLALLSGLNCEYGQGYYFSKPVDGSHAGRLIGSMREDISAGLDRTPDVRIVHQNIR
jgi:EAL domain-containing protein (putative c-di-GMP-specific phosphodiesterase class I)